MPVGRPPESWALAARVMLVLLTLLTPRVASPQAALAHAELARAEPAVDAIVASSPARVSLWFAEEPELRYSEIQVVDRTGRRLDRGDLRGDPTDRLALSVGLPDLAPGSYGVVWRAFSAVDGHTTRGAYTFTVGLDQTPTEVAIGASQTSSTATPERILVRLLTYLGYAGFLGAIPFLWLIVVPATNRARSPEALVDASIRRSRRLALAALGIGILAAVAGLVLQAADAAGTSVAGALGEPLASVAFGTRYGVFWWVRLGLTLAVGALLLLPKAPRQPRLAAPLALGITAAALLAHALSSHSAAATGSALAPVITDWAHLVALTVWVGGLVHLVSLLGMLSRTDAWADAVRLGAAVIPRFSTLAATAVTTLALTGLYQSWLLVGRLPALVGTAYGRALLLKLLLVGLLLAPAGVNLVVLRPRLAQISADGEGPRLLRRLRHSAMAELLLAVAVFAVAGTLANLQPARDAQAAQGVEASASDEGVRSRAIVGGRATAPPLAEGDVLLGIELLLLGAGALAIAFRAAPSNLRLVRKLVPVGAVAVLAGSLIAGGGFATLSAQGATRNPIPPTRESVARGRAIYAERCVMCHGETGRGDGPYDAGLLPRPADFRVHLAAGHTDAQLFDWITNGVPGTAMPRYDAELDATDRWHLINYIKTSYGPGALPAAATPTESNQRNTT